MLLRDNVLEEKQAKNLSHKMAFGYHILMIFMEVNKIFSLIYQNQTKPTTFEKFFHHLP